MPKERKLPTRKIDGRTVGAKKTRVTKEENRLLKIFEKLPADAFSVAQGLIRRAAHMRITLDDYEKDIDENGTVELFQQSAGAPPYERSRPVVSNYNSLAKNYQTITKQLTDLLPKDDEGSGSGGGAPKNDGFEDFLNKKNS
ncbi:hypothetical protein [Paenibacillus harenae]|uniref:hypothetical protein n=1 Tax=Paenibacillus harenae TaxID=306543 RepID=UPI0004099FD4|nr:hypothetical protein [Paenibacillus harenae]